MAYRPGSAFHASTGSRSCGCAMHTHTQWVSISAVFILNRDHKFTWSIHKGTATSLNTHLGAGKRATSDMLCRRGRRALPASPPSAARDTSRDCRAFRHVATRSANGAVPPARPVGRSRTRPSAGGRPPQQTLKAELPFALALAPPGACHVLADPNRCPTRSTPHAPRWHNERLSSPALPTFGRHRFTAAGPGPSRYQFPRDPEKLRSLGRSPFPLRPYSSQARSSSPSQTFCLPSTSQAPPPSEQNTMVANKIDGTAIAKAIRERLRLEILEKQQTNPRYKPCLKIIQGAPQQPILLARS